MGGTNELYCSIVKVDPLFGLTYVVRDSSGEDVAVGMSSDLAWVMHDAGGYHTKRNFDERYGAGNWRVNYLWLTDEES